MTIRSLSWFGFTMLTLVHAASIPVTDNPVSPTEAGLVTDGNTDRPSTDTGLVTEDYPDSPSTDTGLVTEDYPDSPSTDNDGGDWMGGTDEDSPWGFTCPDGWTMHSTQCLLFVPQNLTWNETKENCASTGEGSLAAVYSDIQAHEIYNELKRAGHHGGEVWVGGSRASGNSSWSWLDSSFPVLAKFCDEQSSVHENHCLQVSFDDRGSGCLKGTNCDAGLPSVCAILLY